MYNTGIFNVFDQSGFPTNSTINAELINPRFSPAGAQFTNVYASYISPSLISTAATSGGSMYGLSLSLSIRAQSMTISSAYTLAINGPTISSGTLGTYYGLFVTGPSTSGSGVIKNTITASIGQFVGIGTSLPANMLDIGSGNGITGLAVGTYAGGLSVPTNTVSVSGAVGIGTAQPAYPLDVQGAASAFQILAPATTAVNQEGVLAESINQSGFGSSAVGPVNKLNSNQPLFFDLSAAGITAGSYTGGAYDGRYLYLAPSTNSTTVMGTIVRYDTFSSFSSSTSYASFNSTILNSISLGFFGAAFDGRYVYFIPCGDYVTAAAPTGIFFGLITRYDTTLPFTSSTSYAVFDTTRVNSMSTGFRGSVFDGRYLYLVPTLNQVTYSGQVTRYDTEGSFSSLSSYSIYDMRTTLSSLCRGFYGGTFDGRYVYYAPFVARAGAGFNGTFTRYDTTRSFSASSSYQYIDLTTVNSMGLGFNGAVFDGTFVYLIPNTISAGLANGQIMRYDTRLSFTASSSYAMFDTKNVDTRSAGFQGGGFDGRYLYTVPWSFDSGTTFNGVVTTYDTSASFSVSTSYASFNLGSLQSNSIAFSGAIYTGANIYFIPQQQKWNSVANAQITQITAFAGPPTTTPVIGYASGITVTGPIMLTMPTSLTAISGTGTTVPATAAGFLLVSINGSTRRIPYFN